MASPSLMDLIDLRESKRCKVRLNGEEVGLVKMLTKKEGKFAMVEGGCEIPVDDETYDKLNLKLKEHLKKHMFN